MARERSAGRRRVARTTPRGMVRVPRRPGGGARRNDRAGRGRPRRRLHDHDEEPRGIDPREPSEHRARRPPHQPPREGVRGGSASREPPLGRGRPGRARFAGSSRSSADEWIVRQLPTDVYVGGPRSVKHWMLQQPPVLRSSDVIVLAAAASRPGDMDGPSEPRGPLASGSLTATPARAPGSEPPRRRRSLPCSGVPHPEDTGRWPPLRSASDPCSGTGRIARPCGYLP